MPLRLQELIHKFEVGVGVRYIKIGLIVIFLISMAAVYDFVAFRNMAAPEAMDAAQLARNISEGKGYTTDFIRPFSMGVIQEHLGGRSSLIKEGHPDLANAPVYPTILAGLLKILPSSKITDKPKQFRIYKTDLYIAIANQVLLLTAVVMLFFLAARLFDKQVAWVSAGVFLGSDLIWRFSVSGLSTMLLIVILLGLVWCFVILHQWYLNGRQNIPLIVLAVVAGLLVGLAGLTRYAMAWLIIPTIFYLALFFGPKRTVLLPAALAAFLVVMAPWITRNVMVSGKPFGTAGYALFQGTTVFPEDRLERALQPGLRGVRPWDCLRKLTVNLREITQTDLPRLGGSWVAAFFLVGLLVPFKNPTLSGLRWFLIVGLVVFLPVQALGKTYLSTETVEVNSENLLVLFSPLVLMFGVSLFFLFLDSLVFPFLAARYFAVGAFIFVACLPLFFTLLPPRVSPVAYPPYYPPIIQQTANWMGEKELIMSDIPWAIAWYGKRQSVWIPMNWKKDFFEISDYHRTVKAIYLTPRTTDGRFLSNWVKGENHNWGNFLLESIARKEVPAGFPLRRSPEGFFPEQLFLTDYDRWSFKGR